MPLLDDILIRSERALECRLAGIALVHPQNAARLAIRPELDLAALRFFTRFDKRQTEILAGDELRAINFAWRCAGPDVWQFLREIEDINAYLALGTINDELTALRAVRKTITWIEQTGLFEAIDG